MAKDGKVFARVDTGRKYDEANGALTRKSLADINKAPGGSTHEDALKNHGLAMDVRIVREGSGRTRITAVHADGFKHTSVHPETYRAVDIGKDLLGIEPPPAVATHGRSRAQPQGPKEEERVRKEDGREDDDAIE